MILTAPSGFHVRYDCQLRYGHSHCDRDWTAHVYQYFKLYDRARSTKTFTPTASTITVYVTTASSSYIGRSIFTWSGIKVRPTSGTPLASWQYHIQWHVHWCFIWHKHGHADGSGWCGEQAGDEDRAVQQRSGGRGLWHPAGGECRGPIWQRGDRQQQHGDGHGAGRARVR